jgi:hypothetical protein
LKYHTYIVLCLLIIIFTYFILILKQALNNVHKTGIFSYVSGVEWTPCTLKLSKILTVLASLGDTLMNVFFCVKFVYKELAL